MSPKISNPPSLTSLQPLRHLKFQWLKERRRGEEIGTSVVKFLAEIIPPLRKYRPIEAGIVVAAMIKAANQQNQAKLLIYELDQIFQILR